MNTNIFIFASTLLLDDENSLLDSFHFPYKLNFHCCKAWIGMVFACINSVYLTRSLKMHCDLNLYDTIPKMKTLTFNNFISTSSKCSRS